MTNLNKNSPKWFFDCLYIRVVWELRLWHAPESGAYIRDRTDLSLLVLSSSFSLIIMIVKSFTLHYLIATWRNHCCFMLYLYKKWMHVEAYDSLYISHTAVCYLPKQPELVTIANWPNLTHNKINMKQNFLRGSLFCDLSQGHMPSSLLYYILLVKIK